MGNNTQENQSNQWHTSYESLKDPNEVEWSKLTFVKKLAYIFFIFLKILLIFATICIFICSLALLSDSLTIIGGGGSEMNFINGTFIQNPVSASIAGIAMSSILLSGNALMSILVGMIASGLITVHQAIPIMLGTEIGASLTNALISLTQSGDRNQFRRAFAAVTVNDIFNILLYIIVLPIELSTGIIEIISGLLVHPLKGAKAGEIKTLNFLTDPVLNLIIQIDEEALDEAKSGSNSKNSNPNTYILRCIDFDTSKSNDTCLYNHIFAYSTWSDTVIGIILLLSSVFLLVACLLGIVKLTQMLLKGHLGMLVRELMDKSLPWPFTFLTDYLVMLIGCLCCIIIQSSDVFRTILTPLVGIGVVTLEKLYALLLGGNVGTTFTGVLAALSSDPSKLEKTLQIALAQVIYNIIGILLFYPIPFMRNIPLGLAKKLGNIIAEYRWFALVYILFYFYLIPGSLFGLSFLPLPVLLPIILSIILIIAIIITINLLQTKNPKFLPKRLRNWEFLPIYMHSLKPYDKVIGKYWNKVAKKFKHGTTPTDTSSLNYQKNS